MLKNKTVILGVSGGIAAYKSALLASALKKEGADVHVLMTKNATNFINPITFETLTANKCIVDTFDREFEFKVEHIELAKKADLMIVAPASANIIAKFANGIADDMLSTTALACKCRILVSPAMNTRMYENKIVQDNINKLRQYDFEIIEPESGYLACGDTGKGKLPDTEYLLDKIIYHLAYKKDLKGKKVLVSAGPTIEAIDPVRFISNYSTGKMGIEIAKAAYLRGAKVSLVLGKSCLQVPEGIKKIAAVSAKDMFEACKKEFETADITIKAAAVADYRPKNPAKEKIKKSADFSVIELERTDDIIAYLGKIKRKEQFLCGFSMETENLFDNSIKKLKNKNLDMIIANSISTKGAGFAGDTNIINILTESENISLPIMKKSEAAHKILDEIIRQREGK